VPDPWPAPTASAPLAATVRVPGSKSATNRALLLSALAEGESRLVRPLRSRDTLLMAEALRALGVSVSDAAATRDDPAGTDWVVHGVPGPLRGGVRVDVGNAGTVARFVPPVATLADGPVSFDGDPRMRERPLGPLVRALRTLGADIDDGGRGAIPLIVNGRSRLAGGTVSLDASSSSQLVSGLLLSAPRWESGVVLTHTGERVPSGPHLAMTVQMLRESGAEVEVAGDGGPGTTWRVRPGELQRYDRAIEPDLSSAAPFLAAALVAGGSVTVAGWPEQSTQPGALLPELLAAMGAEISRDGQGLTVRGAGPSRSGAGSDGGAVSRGIRGVDVDLSDVGELTPVLAAVAALADSSSTLRGVAHLRGQETDRLAALATEINRLGGSVRETADGLTIEPRPLHGARVATYDDHRMAMAAAVLGLAVPGVLVENVATTAKTVPGFVSLWAGMMPS